MSKAWIYQGKDTHHRFTLDWSHGRSARLHKQMVTEAGEWCVRQFGLPENGTWFIRAMEFFIYDKAMATAFRLRWC